MIDPDTMRRRTAPLALVVALLVIAGLAHMMTARLQRVATFERPDHRYQVVVLRKRAGWPVGPGQSGDAAGEVRLVDRAGRVLERTSVDMIQVVEKVDWEDRRVVIKLVADWPLPD